MRRQKHALGNRSDQAQGLFVAHEDEVGVHLQDAGGHFRGDRAEEGFLHDLGLAGAVDHHQHLTGLHNGLDAHGVGLLRHKVLVAVEEALVGLDGGFGQINAVGLQLKRLARLVEADVAVRAKAQQLQVDAAHAVDDLVVLGAGIVCIGVGAIRQVDVRRVDVHMIEQVAVHEAPVAFRVVLC